MLLFVIYSTLHVFYYKDMLYIINLYFCLAECKYILFRKIITLYINNDHAKCYICYGRMIMICQCFLNADNHNKIHNLKHSSKVSLKKNVLVGAWLKNIIVFQKHWNYLKKHECGNVLKCVSFIPVPQTFNNALRTKF